MILMSDVILTALSPIRVGEYMVVYFIAAMELL